MILMRKIIKTPKGKINTLVQKDHVSFTIKQEGAKSLRLRYEKAGLNLKQNIKIADLPDNPFSLAKRIFAKIAKDKAGITADRPFHVNTKDGIAEVRLRNNSFTIVVRKQGQTNTYLTSRHYGVYEDVTANGGKNLKTLITAIEHSV